MSARVDHLPETGRFAAASEWLLRLQAEDMEAEEFARWLAWYEEDPLNRSAFDEAQAAYESVRGMSESDRERGMERLLRKRWRWPRGGLAYAAAAVVALVFVLAGHWIVERTVPPAQVTATYQTPLKTHRAETLPDGSIVRLGARSRISLNFSSEIRYLVLESGEAFFTVAKDAARPFVVQAGQVSVRAIGTEFNVRRAGESTTVAVAEGVVEVVRDAGPGREILRSAPEIRLGAGQQVVIEGPAQPPAVRPIQLAAVSAWQTGRLEFDNEPLRRVVATVNRYSSREIVVTDQAIYELSVTGTLDGRHTDEWLRALPEIIPVRVIEVSKETVLVSPAAPR